MRRKAHTAPIALLVLHRRIDKCAMKKISINGQLRNKHFLIIIHRFSLVIAAMSAPCLCKLCKEAVLPTLVMANGVYKAPLFLNFPISKGGTKTIAHLSIGCLIGN
jgi:hypothetical protein